MFGSFMRKTAELVGVNAQTPIEQRIFDAISENDLTRVNKYIEHIDQKNPKGQTPLHYAIELGKDEIVKLLLERGADIEAKNLEGQTPLHIAVELGNKFMTKLLLDNKANIEAQYKNQTPLHIAIELGKDEIVKLLLDGGAGIENIDLCEDTALILAAQKNNIVAFVSIDDKIRTNNYVNERNRLGLSALYYAARNNNITIAKKLKTRDAKLDISLYQGDSDYKSIETITDTLIEAGYDVNDLIQYAAKSRNMGAIEILVSKNADINQQDELGNTAIHYISGTCNKIDIKQLLSMGANINSLNKNNDTALSIVLDKLLKLNSIENRENKSTEELINLKNKYIELSKYLVRKGASVSDNENVNKKLNELAAQYDGFKKMLATIATCRKTEKSHDEHHANIDKERIEEERKKNTWVDRTEETDKNLSNSR